MSDDFVTVPLYMQGRVIGGITINKQDGSFKGEFAPDAMEILREGMNSNVKSVTFESIFGLFAHQQLSAQEKWSIYLTDREPREYWSITDVSTMKIVVRNLPTEEQAKEVAMTWSKRYNKSYAWDKQSGKITGEW